MRKVIVASKNPVKINSTKIAFERVFSGEEFKYEGILVDSNVSDQPKSCDETLTGATNRANNALKAVPDADFFVGLEGGVEMINSGMQAFAWAVVKSKEKSGQAKTGTFFLPKKVVELVDLGKELGHANDEVFSNINSKQKNGAVGILTNDILTRTSFYSDALVLAMIPFMHSDLY